MLAWPSGNFHPWPFLRFIFSTARHRPTYAALFPLTQHSRNVYHYLSDRQTLRVKIGFTIVTTIQAIFRNMSCRSKDEKSGRRLQAWNPKWREIMGLNLSLSEKERQSALSELIRMQSVSLLIRAPSKFQ
jgi:hypothetical protein